MGWNNAALFSEVSWFPLGFSPSIFNMLLLFTGVKDLQRFLLMFSLRLPKMHNTPKIKILFLASDILLFEIWMRSLMSCLYSWLNFEKKVVIIVVLLEASVATLIFATIGRRFWQMNFLVNSHVNVNKYSCCASSNGELESILGGHHAWNHFYIGQELGCWQGWNNSSR